MLIRDFFFVSTIDISCNTKQVYSALRCPKTRSINKSCTFVSPRDDRVLPACRIYSVHNFQLLFRFCQQNHISVASHFKLKTQLLLLSVMFASPQFLAFCNRIASFKYFLPLPTFCQVSYATSCHFSLVMPCFLIENLPYGSTLLGVFFGRFFHCLLINFFIVESSVVLVNQIVTH